jgi:excisionase family DNA binding protein
MSAAREVPAVLYTLAEAAKALRVSVDTVRRMIARNELAFIRIGTCLRVPCDAVEDHVAQHTVPAVRTSIVETTDPSGTDTPPTTTSGAFARATRPRPSNDSAKNSRADRLRERTRALVKRRST